MKAKFRITPYPSEDSMLVEFVFKIDSFELKLNTDGSEESIFQYCKQKLLDMEMEDNNEKVKII